MIDKWATFSLRHNRLGDFHTAFLTSSGARAVVEDFIARCRTEWIE